MMRRSNFVLIAVMMMVFACAHVIGLQKIAAARSNSISLPPPVIDRHAD